MMIIIYLDLREHRISLGSLICFDLELFNELQFLHVYPFDYRLLEPLLLLADSPNPELVVLLDLHLTSPSLVRISIDGKRH